MTLIDHPELGSPGELAHGDFEMVVRRLADDLAFGTDASLFTGSGLEYAQSRPYEPGDPVRQMDWRLTARAGKPFIKEYEALKRTNVLLLVDTSASMGLASGTLSKHELSIWLAAAIGLVAQRRLSPVAVIGGGERETRYEPSLLRTDLWHALEPMRRGAMVEGTQVGRRLEQLVVRAQRASVIVVLSDLHDPEALPAIRHAAQRHDVIVLELRDPAEDGLRGAGFFRGREAESGQDFLGHGRLRWRRRRASERGALGGSGGTRGRGAADARDAAGGRDAAAARGGAGGRDAADAFGDGDEPVERMIARAGASHLRLRTDQAFIPPLRHFLAARAATGGGRG